MEVATLIGDLVASREHADRRRLHDHLHRALARANQLLDPRQPLEVTIGDEFQGRFATVADATRASLLVRLMLLMDEHGSDSRYGVGLGTVTVFDATRSPVSQDGPGWWSARAAIERSATLAKSPRTSFVRTCFAESPATTDSGRRYEAAIDAFLLCRDAAVSHMTDRQRRLLLGVLLGHNQVELAAHEGVTQGAVSQTLSRSGATSIELAHRRLEELFE